MTDTTDRTQSFQRRGRHAMTAFARPRPSELTGTILLALVALIPACGSATRPSAPLQSAPARQPATDAASAGAASSATTPSEPPAAVRAPDVVEGDETFDRLMVESFDPPVARPALSPTLECLPADKVVFHLKSQALVHDGHVPHGPLRSVLAIHESGAWQAGSGESGCLSAAEMARLRQEMDKARLGATRPNPCRAVNTSQDWLVTTKGLSQWTVPCGTRPDPSVYQLVGLAHCLSVSKGKGHPGCKP